MHCSYDLIRRTRVQYDPVVGRPTVRVMATLELYIRAQWSWPGEPTAGGYQRFSAVRL